MEMIKSVKLDEKYKDVLLEFQTREDIPEEWLDTPIGSFILSQNFGWPIQTTGTPQLTIATCIEFRYSLPIPRMYAYVIRRASGRIIGSEFSVAYTLAKGVKHLLMIGHNDCGMSHIDENGPLVINALIEQGWSEETARAYVAKHGARHAINDELDSLRIEYERIRKLFPKLVIAPLFVCLSDSHLYLPKWYKNIEHSCPESVAKGSVDDELILALP